MSETSLIFLRCLVPLFIIVAPLGAVPLFIAITAGDPAAARRRQALVAAVTATVALLLAALVGQRLLALFTVTLPAFRIAGGIILFAIAFELLNVRTTRMKSTEAERDAALAREQVGIIPMGIPMLAGPGAFTAVLALAAQHHGRPAAVGALLGAVLAVGVISAVVLVAADWLARHLGPIILAVVSRLEGLILAAIAVQMVLDGLLVALPGLAV
jgi:multiple antibiotic resistance protein